MLFEFEELSMYYPIDTEPKEDTTEDQHLVLDGTVNLYDSDEDEVPRVKGLIELLSQFFSDKPNQNL